MNTNKERCSAASPGHVVRDSPYRRPRRTLDYGTVALQQIKVVPLRERVEARRRRTRRRPRATASEVLAVMLAAFLAGRVAASSALVAFAMLSLWVGLWLIVLDGKRRY